MNIFDKKINKVKQFEKVTKGKSKQETRNAEEHLLKPESIKKYTGEQPKYKSELASRTALIVFRNKAQQDLIGELFSIRTSVNGDTYITDIELLEALAKGVRDGKYQVVDEAIQLCTEIARPDTTNFKPLTKEQIKSLPKKKRKKYKKLLAAHKVDSMAIFQAKYFPDLVGEECPDCGADAEHGRQRRKLR